MRKEETVFKLIGKEIDPRYHQVFNDGCIVKEALPMLNSYCSFDWLVTSKYNRISSAR